MLPDVALLNIFDFYMPWITGFVNRKQLVKEWHTLVHVCRRWRNLVFGSPRRLGLRLYCEARTPAREMLNIWPALPIDVSCNGHEVWGVDNIIAALEHSDRIGNLDFIDPPLQFDRVLAAMQQPVPILRELLLWFKEGTAPPVVPDSFLGGYAPQLEKLSLSRIPFPGLPKLLLSTTHLVHLILSTIPDSGYISPEAMVAGLSVLTRLKRFNIRFESSQNRPDLNSQRPPPPPRPLLPALTELEFEGASEYLEDLVARIDAPLLNHLTITFFHQPIFNTPRLADFISRTPKLKTHIEARVFFCGQYVEVKIDRALRLKLSCEQSDRQFSSLAQVCRSSFPRAFILAVEHLYFLENGFWKLQPDIENGQWLELLRPFGAVKHLYLCPVFIRSIAPALQDLVGERLTEVLPALQTIFLDEKLPSRLVPEAIGQFVAARQLAGHSIAISSWESEFNSNRMPYICSRGYPLYFGRSRYRT
jgi:hypothetical protein